MSYIIEFGRISNFYDDGTSIYTAAKNDVNGSSDTVRFYKTLKSDPDNNWTLIGTYTLPHGATGYYCCLKVWSDRIYFSLLDNNYYLYAGIITISTGALTNLTDFGIVNNGIMAVFPGLAVDSSGYAVAFASGIYTSMGKDYIKAALTRCTPSGVWGAATIIDTLDGVDSWMTISWQKKYTNEFYFRLYRNASNTVSQKTNISGTPAYTTVTVTGNPLYGELFCQSNTLVDFLYADVYSSGSYYQQTIGRVLLNTASIDVTTYATLNSPLAVSGSYPVAYCLSLKPGSSVYYLDVLLHNQYTDVATVSRRKYNASTGWGAWESFDVNVTNASTAAEVHNPKIPFAYGLTEGAALGPDVLEDLLDILLTRSGGADFASELLKHVWGGATTFSLSAALTTPMQVLASQLETMEYQLQIGIAITTPMQLVALFLKSYRYAGFSVLALSHKLTGVLIAPYDRKYVLDVVIGGITHAIPLISFVLRKAKATTGQTVINASFACPLDTSNIIGTEIAFPVKLWSVISGVSFLLLDGIFQGIGINSKGCVLTATGTSQAGPLKEISAEGLSYVRGGVDSKTFRASPNFNLNIGDYFLANGLPVLVSSIVIYVSIDQQFMEVS